MVEPPIVIIYGWIRECPDNRKPPNFGGEGASENNSIMDTVGTNNLCVNKLYTIPPTIVNPKPEDTVRVFSGILDRGRSPARLWSVIRGLDAAGSGWIDIRIEDIAKSLGVTCSTIYRHLSDKIYFPQVLRARGGIIRIYYSAIAKVCVSLGFRSVSDLGACSEFRLDWLGDRGISAIYATEIEAQQKQRQAFYAAKHSTKKGSAERNNILSPSWAVTTLSKPEQRLAANRTRRSDKQRGFKSGVRRAFRYFRIRPEQFVPGTTQKDISQQLNRSERTIQRRLSNRTRIGYGIAPLNRRRVLREFPKDIEKRLSEYLTHIGTDFASVEFGGDLIQIGRISIGDEGPRVYRLLTNIYEFNFELLGSKRARSRVKNLLAHRDTQIKQYTAARATVVIHERVAKLAKAPAKR